MQSSADACLPFSGAPSVWYVARRSDQHVSLSEAGILHGRILTTGWPLALGYLLAALGMITSDAEHRPTLCC